MSSHDIEQAALVSEYLDALGQADAPLPLHLDRETANFARHMNVLLAPPAPDPGFLAALGRKLDAEAAAIQSRADERPRGWGGMFRAFPAAVAAGVALLAVLGATLFFSGDGAEPATAREVAASALAVTTEFDVEPFEMTERVEARAGNAALWADRLPGLTGDETIRGLTVRRFESASRWRVEETLAAYDATGTEVARFERVAVADGVDLWVYDPIANTVTVQPNDPASYFGTAFPFGGGAMDLRTVLEEAATCHTPELTGEATVGGRKAFALDLGASSCVRASGALAPLQGRRLVWIDKETFVTLKVEQSSGVDGELLSTTEVTEIAFGTGPQVGQYVFTPPAGATVQDLRGDVANSAALAVALRGLGEQVGARVFVPTSLPAGVVGTTPALDPLDGWIRLLYAVTPGGSPDPFDVEVRQTRATYDALAAATEGTEVTATASGIVWLRRGDFDPESGTGLASAAMLERDGTFITVQAFAYTPEELVRIALSLEPAPGALPAVERGEPRTFPQLREAAPFDVFAPASVPGGLVLEHPFVRQDGSAFGSVEFHYRNADGDVVLIIRNGSPDCCSGIGYATGPTVTLADGAEATVVREFAGNEERLVLAWREGGTLVLVSSSSLSQDQLMDIASSMTPGFDPGPGALPPRLASP